MSTRAVCVGSHCLALVSHSRLVEPTSAVPPYLEARPLLLTLVAILAVALIIDWSRARWEVVVTRRECALIRQQSVQQQNEASERENKLHLALQESGARETRLLTTLHDVAALQEDHSQLLGAESRAPAGAPRHPFGLLHMFRPQPPEPSYFHRQKPHHLSDCSADQLPLLGSEFAADSPALSYAGSERGGGGGGAAGIGSERSGGVGSERGGGSERNSERGVGGCTPSLASTGGMPGLASTGGMPGLASTGGMSGLASTGGMPGLLPMGRRIGRGGGSMLALPVTPSSTHASPLSPETNATAEVTDSPS